MIFTSINHLTVKKECPDLPIIIPTFNNPTYLRKTVAYFEKRNFNIIVIDNNSTYLPMRALLNKIAKKHIVVAQNINEGPRQFYNNVDFFWNWLPRYFFVTDPDLGFNEELTKKDFLKFIDISNEYNIFKVGVGLRLDIEQGNNLDQKYQFTFESTIRDLETGYLKILHATTDTGDPMYLAPIDTTFALYNKKNYVNFMAPCLRVHGKYEVWHYGWFSPPPIPKEEADYYTQACNGLPFASGEVLKRGEKSIY